MASAVMNSGKNSSRGQALTGAAGRSLLDYRPDLPEMFVRVIEKAIDPDPAKRFASAGALSSALSETLGLPTEKAEPAKEKGKVQILKDLLANRKLIVLPVLAVLWLAGVLHRKPAAPVAPDAKVASADGNSEYLKAEELLLRYDKKSNVTDAIDMLNKADANSAPVQADLCRAYFLRYRVTLEQDLLQQAQTACNKAIELNSSLAPPYVTMARMSAMTGHKALAMTQAQQALKLDSTSAEAYGAEAEVYSAEGRDSDAIAAVQTAINMAPDDWRWPVLLGAYYYKDGRLADAATQYESAVKISQDNSIALGNLGLAAMQLDRLPEAQTNLEKSAQLNPSFWAFTTLGELFKIEGNYQKAIETNKKALELNQTNYMAWGNLGSAYLRAPDGHDEAIKNYMKAIDLAEAARKESPQDSNLLALLGDYYATTGDAVHAAPLLRQAVTLEPDSADVLYIAGDGYELLHKRDQAIPLIAKALALGYHSVQFEHEPELAALRDDPNFKKALLAAQQKHLLDSQNKKG
jgi:tetratricopeptide (TPR) repeat protein